MVKKYTEKQIGELIRNEIIEEFGEDKNSRRLANHYAKKFIKKLEKIKNEKS